MNRAKSITLNLDCKKLPLPFFNQKADDTPVFSAKLKVGMLGSPTSIDSRECVLVVWDLTVSK